MGTSGARLYDAMARGISLLDERPTARRRILVVLAEAQDKGSENKLGEVLRQAQLANVTIYSIGPEHDRRRPSLETQILRHRRRSDRPAHFPVPTPNGMPQTPEIERQMQGNVDLLALAEWLVKTG